MHRYIFGDVTLELIEGDITRQPDMEAIANAANAMLRRGGGVAGAIHYAAGPGLEKEAHPLGPIKPGEAVITSGHNLPNKYVIHCLGPVYDRDIPHDKLLADCYKNAIRLCEGNGIKSIAFPAISTGAFGYPPEEAAPVTLKAIIDAMPSLKSLQTIRVVLFGSHMHEIFREALKKLI
ncbi:MAG: macro domain-containing protein [Bacteroidales bacterium]|nr:macro domain-containing protein [Bacteroidales bacterium]